MLRRDTRYDAVPETLKVSGPISFKEIGAPRGLVVR